jgi:hypothetical protein
MPRRLRYFVVFLGSFVRKAGLPEPCIAPEDVTRSPLLTELVALRDHAARLAWLAGREQCPADYGHLAAEVVDMVLEGWQEQRSGGTFADLTRFAEADAGMAAERAGL